MADPVVQISDGQLKGRFMTDYDGGKIYAFLGIPYAKPPIGELRFQAPLPVEPWKGIRDAIKDGDKCIQRDMFYQLQFIEGTEDCLHLNVYTKQLPSQGSTKLKPVMAWIHGGGFTSGSNSSEMYGPDYLLTEDIVLVSINYRLGTLGFLKISDPSLGVYGNAGLKDQQLALKWIQKNIAAFGGDPNNVTIFGESAGGASVHYHVLSKSSNGLFHKAIMQSGTVLNPWAMQKKLQLAMDLAQFLDKSVNSDKEALNVLRKVTVDELYEAQDKYTKSKQSSGDENIIITPDIEVPNGTAFITDKPYELIMNKSFNKVPMLFGYNRLEGMIMDVMMAGMNKPQSKSQPNLEKVIPKEIKEKESPETIQELCEKIMKVYFTGENANNKYLLPSDTMFIVGIINSVKLHATAQDPVYLYRMDIDDDLNLFKKLYNSNIAGMCHADELGYLFGNEGVPKAEKGSSAETAMRRLVKLWTNFAKYGNPTPNEKELNITWKPADNNAVNFLNIGAELCTEVNPEPERIRLWNEILKLLVNK